MENECPCIDCITLGVCKAIMRNEFSFVKLADRCSLFDVYYRTQTGGMPATIFLLDFFKPLHYRRRIELRKEVMKSKEAREKSGIY